MGLSLIKTIKGLATKHPLSGEKIVYLGDILELNIPDCDKCSRPDLSEEETEHLQWERLCNAGFKVFSVGEGCPICDRIDAKLTKAKEE